MKSKKFNFQGLALILSLIGLISMTIFVVNQEKKEIQEAEPEVVYVDKETEEPLENFTREDSVLVLQNIFKSIGEDVDGKERTPEERLAAIESEDVKLEEIFTEETLSKIHISKDMREDYFNSTFLASSLLTYYLVIQETSGKEDFIPVMDLELLNEAVYFDEEQREVQIPFDVFTGQSKGIAFEMIYVDGEWKFNPYSAMMSLVMLVNYEQEKQILEQAETTEDK